MNTDISRQKKGRTKKKLKLFRFLTVLFACLFIAAIIFAVYKSVSSSNEIVTYLNEIDNMKKQINELRTDLSSMSTEKASLQGQIKELTEKNLELSEKYDKINIDTMAFQTTITSLQSQVDQLSKDKEELQSEYDTAISSLETTRNTNKSLSERAVSLTNQISSLNSTINTLKSENKVLRETIEETGSTVPQDGGTDEGDEKIIDESTASSQSSKIAYLTFDDGVSKYTNEILDILARYNIKATFFPNWKGGNDEKYKRIVEEGHAVGNHTYSHEYDSVYTSLDGFKSEVTSLNEKISKITGYEPVIFRFPGGSNNTAHRKYNTGIMQKAIRAIHDLGMEYYDWNVNSGDADSSKGASKETILSNVLARATMDKAVILMHDTNTKGTTVAALPEIIEGLIAKGYSFGILTDPSAPVVQSLKPE